LTKLQEFATSTSEEKLAKPISCFSINPSSNISVFGERSLGYAFSYEEEPKFYLISEVKKSGGTPFTQVKTLQSEDVSRQDSQNLYATHDRCLTMKMNCTHYCRR